MCCKIIENIFCCPECKSVLKFKNNSALVCLNCNKEYEYDDNLIDFGVEEQKFVNNWSGVNTQEEIMEHLKNMVKEGYFKDEDIPNIQKEIDIDKITQQNSKAIGSIRKNYYLSGNTMIVDLASGYGSTFSSKIGEGMNFDKLKGKTIILTDLSKFVLQKVRERLKDQTKDINMIYAVCNISKLPFKDNSIDFISSVACFINSNCGAELLKEIKRVLSNKKRLGILEFLYEDNSRSQNYLLKDGSNIEYTTANRFEDALIKANFSEIDINILYSGYARMSGDILPLKEDKNIITLINAMNSK